jgi:zinc protease
LVKEKKIFSNIQCYHMGTVDNGLVTIEGKLSEGVDMLKAQDAVNEEIEKLKQHLVTTEELQKVQNKTESIMMFEDMSIMNRANNLAFYELLGDANLINTELQNYFNVTPAEVLEACNTIFDAGNASTIHYIKN